MITENPEQLIRTMIKGTIYRAARESIACIVVIMVFGAVMWVCERGSLRYYGCLLTILGACFVFGVVWLYALSYRLLREHSASDTVFWREVFYSQARLHRFVPLWYLAPMFPGLLLFSLPYEPFKVSWFLGIMSLLVVIFVVATWLNRVVAAQIESRAEQLA